MAELKYWVWLAEKHGVGIESVFRLISHYSSPEKVFFAKPEELKTFPWLKKAEITALSDKSLESAVKIVDFCNKNRVNILTIRDAAYPERLKNIFAPPILLYILGKMPDMDEEVAVAIVGTRKCSDYGRHAAEKIAKEFAYSGGTVVTGMALGIDSAAARGAIKGGGKVIAVLGSGIDVLYPLQNRKLFKEVYKHGAIITEFAPGTEPHGYNFPRRNRIISGLSLGVLVVEAPEKSGSLITASYATEQGRDVFVVPGDIDKQGFIGSNNLLRDGAAAVTTGYQLADEYIALYPEKLAVRFLNDSEEKTEEDDFVYIRKHTSPEKDLEDNGTEQSAGNDISEDKPTKVEIDNKKAVEYIDLSTTPDLLDEDEKKVVLAMSGDGDHVHIDEIITKSALSAAAVLSALTMLEIKGYVSRQPGKCFTLNILLKY